MIEWLINADVELFLFLNSFNSNFFDFVMFWISERFIWIPFYAFLLFLLAKHYKWEVLAIIVFVTLLITITDQSSVHLFKRVFMRWRPCFNPEIKDMVHLAYDTCRGSYGFVSSHAANSFAFSCFIIYFLYKKVKYIVPVMIIWAMLKSYSRIYLGVHYPADIVVGAMLGIVSAFLVILLYVFVKKNVFPFIKKNITGK